MQAQGTPPASSREQSSRQTQGTSPPGMGPAGSPWGGVAQGQEHAGSRLPRQQGREWSPHLWRGTWTRAAGWRWHCLSSGPGPFPPLPFWGSREREGGTLPVLFSTCYVLVILCTSDFLDVENKKKQTTPNPALICWQRLKSMCNSLH